MGIKYLHKFLRKHVPECYIDVGLTAFSGKRVAVDINVYLYKYKSVSRERWATSFLNHVLLLMKNNIQAVYIYDTKAPTEKDMRKEERRQKRRVAEEESVQLKEALKIYDESGTVLPILTETCEKHSQLSILFDSGDESTFNRDIIMSRINKLENQAVNITKFDMYLTKDILKALGVPYIDSENEAETLCSYLCCHGLVDAVMSDDTDVLVYGTPRFLTRLNHYQENCVQLLHADILRRLDMTPTQFRDFCIMCGTDYNSNIRQISCEKAFHLLKKYNDFDTLQAERPDLDYKVLNHTRTAEIFTVPPVLPEYNLEATLPNLEAITSLLEEYNVPYSREKLTSVINLVHKNQNATSTDRWRLRASA